MQKSIIKNSIFNIIYRLLNVLFPMITAMYVGRVLLPDGIGKVNYSLNILSYFLVFASLGIPIYGAREIARVQMEQEKRNKIFSELFILNFFSTLFCVILYFSIILNITLFKKEIFLFFSISIQLILNFCNIDWFYQGMEEYGYITLRSSAIKIISIIMIFLFIKEQKDYILYAFINSLAITSNYLFNIYNLQKKVILNIQGLNLKKHIKPIFILLLTMLASDLYNQIDITMLGSFSTNKEIGYYSYAIKIIRIINTIPYAIVATTLPRLSQYYSENKTQEFKQLVSKSINIIGLFVFPCAIGINFLAKYIIEVLFGNLFSPSIYILKILLPITVIVPFSYMCGSIVLTAINKEHYLLIATSCGVTTNIILNIFMIPKYGGIGAGIASVFAELTVFLIHIFFAQKYIEFKISKKDLMGFIISILTMFFVILIILKYFENSFVILFLSTTIGSISFITILIITKNSALINLLNSIRRK
jgi:O-antigen/teichoic acid export membrane protein